MATLIHIDSAQPGMTLAEDVFDHFQRPLVRAETVLTERHLKIFRTWGVVMLSITNDDGTSSAPSSDAIDPELQRRAEEIGMALFRHTDRAHPMIGELYPIILRRIESELKSGERHG